MVFPDAGQSSIPDHRYRPVSNVHGLSTELFRLHIFFMDCIVVSDDIY